MLEFWEQRENSNEVQQEATIALNQSITTRVPLTTYTYKIAVLMWYRLVITLFLDDHTEVVDFFGIEDFTSIKTRQSSIEDNGTILSNRSSSSSLMLGTIFLEERGNVFSKLLQYQIDKKRKLEFERLFSSAITLFEMDAKKALRILERNAIYEETTDQAYDICRLLFVMKCCQKVLRNSENTDDELSSIIEILEETTKKLLRKISILDEETLILLEYLFLPASLPFTSDKYATGLSALFIFMDELDLPFNEISFTDAEIYELANTARKYTLRYNEIKQSEVWKTAIRREVIDEGNNAPLYMKYIQGIANIDQVIVFQDQMQQLNDAYWSRDYVRATEFYEKLTELPDLQWDVLAEARKQYVDDIYPDNLRNNGMVSDLGSYYFTRAMYQWGVQINYDKAIEFFNKASNQFLHNYDQISCDLNIGTLYFRQKDFETCYLFYQRCQAKKINDSYPEVVAVIKINEAKINMYNRDFSTALNLLELAIKAAEKSLRRYPPEIRNESVTNGHPYWLKRWKPIILVKLNKIEEALDCLTEQFSFSQKIGPSSFLNKIFHYDVYLLYHLIILGGYKGYLSKDKDESEKLSLYNDFLDEKIIEHQDIHPSLQIRQSIANLLTKIYLHEKVKTIDINHFETLIKNAILEYNITIPAIYTLLILKLLNNIELKRFVKFSLGLPIGRISLRLKFDLYLLQAITASEIKFAYKYLNKAKEIQLISQDKLMVTQINYILEILENNFNKSNSHSYTVLAKYWIEIALGQIVGMNYMIETIVSPIIV